MEIQKKYPEEFIGRKKYKLVKEYKFFGLYETKQGYKICFDLEGIRSEIRRAMKNDNS